MNTPGKTWKLGALDGLVNGVFLFLLGELVVSTLVENHLSVCFYLAVLFAVFSVLFFCFLSAKTDGKITKLYVIGQLFFVFAIILSFIYYINMPFSILPRRDLGNVDGFVILSVNAVYLLVSQIMRFAVFISVAINRKIKKHFEGKE